MKAKTNARYYVFSIWDREDTQVLAFLLHEVVFGSTEVCLLCNEMGICILVERTGHR